ncbi:MAG: DNA replication/repair protein RecF [Eggerthellaceae bacterium]
MSFRVSRISLATFRNYRAFSCQGFGNLNIFVGPNATGKTNLLEAVELTTALSSFRNPQTTELIAWDEPEAKISLEVEDGPRRNTITLQVSEGKKTFGLNGKKASRSDLAGMVPSVLFSPDDLRLVKDGSSLKRRALDAMGEQISGAYRAVRRDYEKIIRQKARLLKEGVDATYLSSVNDTVAMVGTQLELYRRQISLGISSLISDVYRDMMGKPERVEFVYLPSWESPESENGALGDDYLSREAILREFQEALVAMEAQELARGRCLVGPHLDVPRFLVEGRDASLFASQGQQRSVALSFKMSQLLYIQEKTGHKPILLLDDVMSELDEVRRSALMAYISSDTQTFITTTNLNYFTKDELAEAQVFALENMMNQEV